ncbi:MAG: hypothetical protein LBS82_01840 [Spirochaetaceae bacterium]|jgi:hypothetical protein|nr:hypothetical protein [Spirochaetaceae bacterium]
MKKCISVLALATIVAGGVFSQEQETTTPAEKKAGLFSAGVGAYLTGDFGGGYEYTSGSTTRTTKMPYFGGGFLFLDATYAELSFGFFGGGGTTTSERTGRDATTTDFSVTGLDIGLLGKYPIALGSLTVFPIFGINYRVIVGAKTAGYEVDKPGDFSAFWFKFGGGLDYAITNNVYLRGDLLYGIRLANKVENDAIDGRGDDAKTRLGHGIDVKVAVGYKL